jgi:hypothetical protein
MEPEIDKAFDFAAESAKQLIGLSTGVIALTISFAHDLLVHVPGGAVSVLMLSWLAYLLSLFSGVWTLLALTGTLEPGKQTAAVKPSIRGTNVTVPSGLQILLFMLATGLLVIFAIWAARAGSFSVVDSRTPARP